VSELEEAERTDRELREQIADLVSARARAESEAQRLLGRSGLDGADPTLADIAERYRLQVISLGAEIDAVRASLREHEVDVERLRAQSSGV
jgi:hypothetical protein